MPASAVGSDDVAMVRGSICQAASLAGTQQTSESKQAEREGNAGWQAKHRLAIIYEKWRLSVSVGKG